MDDLIARLKQAGTSRIVREATVSIDEEIGIAWPKPEVRTVANSLCFEAATEIEQLRAKLEKAIEALRPFAKTATAYMHFQQSYDLIIPPLHPDVPPVSSDDLIRAAKTLKEISP